MAKYKCPKCGCGDFEVYVTDYPAFEVDEDGNVVKQHIYNPSDNDEWVCSHCGETGTGYNFLIKENDDEN